MTGPPPLPPGFGEGRARAGFPFGAVAIDFALALLLLLVLVFGLALAVMLPALIATGGQGGDEVVQRLLPELTLAAVGATLLTALLLWALRRGTLRGTLPIMPAGRAYVLAAAAGAAIQAGAFAIHNLLAQSGNQVSPSNAAPIQALQDSAPWLAWATIVVVAPLAEELLFRHVLLRRFLLAGRAMVGLVLTSFLFALLHEPVPASQSIGAWLASLGLYTGMGMAFGAVYLRTGRLGATFAAHAFCNLLALALMAYSQS